MDIEKKRSHLCVYLDMYVLRISIKYLLLELILDARTTKSCVCRNIDDSINSLAKLLALSESVYCGFNRNIIHVENIK